VSNGLNDFATNTEMRVALREPFAKHLITQVDKGFGKIDTINHAVVTDRLNAVAPGWTISEPHIVQVEFKDGTPHVLAVWGSMTIGTVTRWEVGEVERPSTYGDELKKAMSDFLKRAAMRFGVGIDLWSKADLLAERGSSGSVAVTAAPSRQAGREQSVAHHGAADGEAAGDDSRSAGGGESTPAVSLPIYLTKDDQGLLKAEYGSQLKALDAYRSKFGERVRSLSDITYEMRDEMGASA
jgi:hypothetical protein